MDTSLVQGGIKKTLDLYQNVYDQLVKADQMTPDAMTKIVSVLRPHCVRNRHFHNWHPIELPPSETVLHRL